MKLTQKGILRTLAFTGMMMAAGAAAQAEVGFGVRVGPAVVYDNYGHGNEYVPPCPGDGYFWVPAYYSDGGWIAGRWVFRNGFHNDFRRDYRIYAGGRDYGRHDFVRREFDHHDFRADGREHQQDHGDRGWDHGRR